MKGVLIQGLGWAMCDAHSIIADWSRADGARRLLTSLAEQQPESEVLRTACNIGFSGSCGDHLHLDHSAPLIGDNWSGGCRHRQLTGMCARSEVVRTLPISSANLVVPRSCAP